MLVRGSRGLHCCMGQEGIAGEEEGQLGLLGWLIWACLHAEQDLRGKGLALDVLCSWTSLKRASIWPFEQLLLGSK